MSLKTVGYTPEGKPIRVDEGPGYGGSVRLGGDLVTSEERRREPVPGTPRVVEAPIRELAQGCALEGRCRHHPCTALRAQEARRLYDSTNLTLGQIGAMLGGRDHSTVIYWLRIAAA